VISVGFPLHIHPLFPRARTLIAAGEIGSIHCSHDSIGIFQTLRNSSFRYQTALPGELFMEYAHEPDLFYFLTRNMPAGAFTASGKVGTYPCHPIQISPP
jgi:predicted dehydrogenase